MKLYIDSADTQAIRELMEFLPVDGVTTNPKILAASGRAPFEVLAEIREIVGADGELFAQTIARDAEGMLADSERLRAELGANTITKIPVTSEGLKAIRELKAQGHPVLGTAIYSAMQAWLAGKAGADYVAPYVNRMYNLELDGCEVASDICDIFQMNDIPTQVVGASFKNLTQVLNLVRADVDAVTVDPSLLKAAIDQAVVEDAVIEFEESFAKLVGKGKTLVDL